MRIYARHWWMMWNILNIPHSQLNVEYRISTSLFKRFLIGQQFILVSQFLLLQTLDIWYTSFLKDTTGLLSIQIGNSVSEISLTTIWLVFLDHTCSHEKKFRMKFCLEKVWQWLKEYAWNVYLTDVLTHAYVIGILRLERQLVLSFLH